MNNVSYKGKVDLVKPSKMEENTEEVIAKGGENEEEIMKSDTPPSPPRARKLSRRSSVAIARRLSRASAAGCISLEEQLEIVPARDEAPTDARLTQVSEGLRRYEKSAHFRVSMSVGDPELSVNSDPDSTVYKSVRVQFMQFLRESGHTLHVDCIIDIFLWNISESSRNSSVCFFVLVYV